MKGACPHSIQPPGWLVQILGTDLANDAGTCEEIRRLVSSVLDARSAIIPLSPARTFVLAEDSQEYMYDNEVDLNPELLALIDGQDQTPPSFSLRDQKLSTVSLLAYCLAPLD